MQSRSSVEWYYPIQKQHAGVPLGNGTMGLLIWGTDTLCITIARAGFWDHRGANPVLDRATFAEVKSLLQTDDAAGLDRLFGRDQPKASPDRPCQYGGGRLEITFANGFKPLRASLDVTTAEVSLELRSGHETQRLRIGLHPTDEIAWLKSDTAGLLDGAVVTLTPAFETTRERLEDRGMPRPEKWNEKYSGGFIQCLPDDEPLAVAWKRTKGSLLLGSALGADARAIVQARVQEADVAAVRRDAEAWWSSYWKAVPQIQIPDVELQRYLDLGLYKQAGLNPPHAEAATLQGCFMEDYQIPPWSNDYHFNINVQLVYSACLPSNRPEHMGPLWSMVTSWFPKLREYGERFFERDGAMLLPHAVDDRCNVIGTFWAGTIDHACTAWIAQMAWLHYRHTMDEKVLRDIAWPLMVGAFEGFWVMFEQKPDGSLTLPVSVSPEYHRDHTMAGQWGRDSSFQMAAAHMTAQLLQRAARVLGRDLDPRWQAVLDRLPPYASMPDPHRADQRRITLWDGHDLTKSHRHHAHLAGLWPFCTIDPFDERHNRAVANTIGHWTWIGAGEWTGWCVPWASIIYARMGLATPAILWLKWWAYAFCNEGYGTLHNGDFAGTSAFSDGGFGQRNFRRDPSTNYEIMQMEAAMSLVTAVCELLVQCRWSTGEPVIHLLPAGLPKGWRELEFDGLLTEGAFLCGVTVREAAITQVRIRSVQGQELVLATAGLGQCRIGDEPLRSEQSVARIPTSAGQTIVIDCAQ
ncbi:MAG TPA: hypothetical protein VGN72_03765 [Tepidisphaeraceae bacterium]|jgi:hypothetical protein|nr:hypothetical protein [Tepidisphaeraceae bacterium]